MTDEGVEPEYNQRLVAATLACAAVSIGGAILALGIMVGMSKSSIPLAPIMLTLLLIQVPGAIAALVLSILGGMWRRGLDGATTAVLLVTTLGADLMLWPFMATQTNVSIVGFGQCVSPMGSCNSDGTADLWIGVGVQTLLLALVLTCMAHWLWRLKPAAFGVKKNRLAMLAVGFVLAAVIAAIDGNISTTVSVNISDSNGPGSGFGSFPPAGLGNTLHKSGSVTIGNDLNTTVRVVYCPQTDCTGQVSSKLAPGAHKSMTSYATSDSPDSIVVLDGSNGPACETIAYPLPTGPVLLSGADPGVCDMDLQTLTVPH